MAEIDQNTLILIGLGVVALLLLVMIILSFARSRKNSEEQQNVAEDTQNQIAALFQANTALENSIKGMNETHIRSQEEMRRSLDLRLESVGKRVGDSLEQSREKTGESLSALQERLAVIDQAQKNIMDLSGEMVSLQEILSDKQARGTFGEIQLNDLVSAILPPNAFDFQVTMNNGKRADCLINLPNPPGPIVIDSKFPLEAYRKLRESGNEVDFNNAKKQFRKDLLNHIKAIADKYIIAGETAESALMFLPSEAIYAELHTSYLDVVDKSYLSKVWIVSPTTLMALLNTIRAVLKDARIRDQAGVIQKYVTNMTRDVSLLDERVGKLQTHMRQSDEDIENIFKSTKRITTKINQIEKIQLEDEISSEEALKSVSTEKINELVNE